MFGYCESMQLCNPGEPLRLCLTRRQAELCGLLASPVRLEILYLLGERERSVSELGARLGLAPPNLSQHLRLLRDQNVVAARREGRHVRYQLVNRKLLGALDLLREALHDDIARAHAATQADPLLQSVAS